ncbi:glycosyltransferase family 4 protein [Bdellovibrio sp. HCB288]|uniref:glycosyltransferase family 4 protein n=1 Tax=Bdellovibrio sp. HCB288 TaxID=3394355 RepID=UPI0039B68A4E
MKRILFVSSLQIFPPMSGGQLRSANLCRAFARMGYDVEVYSLTGRKESYLAKQSSFTQQPEKHIRETVNMNPILGVIQFLFYRLQLPPLWVTWLLKLLVPARLRQSLKEADLVILDFPFLSPLLKHAQTPVWLNTHNAEFELWGNPVVSGLVKRIEVQALKKADRVIFCSEQDRQKFVGVVSDLTHKSFLVSNGVDASQFAWTSEFRNCFRQSLGVADKKVLLFTGSSYQPNQEAFQFLKAFAEENKSTLLELGVLILVVGTVSQEQLNEPHLKVAGRVDDIMPYFAASDFGLNPVILGSGVNVKMIEFMAARLPILSTEFGCRGLDLEDRRNCFVFSRDNLLQTLKQVLAVPEDEIKNLSASALQSNESKVDMTKALVGTGL